MSKERAQYFSAAEQELLIEGFHAREHCKGCKSKERGLAETTKKRAEQKKTGGGPAPPRHTPAEELALGWNATRPIVEGIPGGSSSLDQQPGCSSSSTFITGK
ncbi:N-acetylmuramate/N-acetylglucosamine kinase [Labeo rohita]|uniref:N-acetylmuramate/N-acetylglucosamine kinase n=1 Tax=Labeo rohita TaxID=84645 RepID=A0ABQ8L8T5_LABRO|nr:N-acetylmuramate/N-acetylglucosamine kinase [Labeo rohita]